MEYEGMSTGELIRLAKDAEDISVNTGFLKNNTGSFNTFENPNFFKVKDPGDSIYPHEVSERREKLFDNITASELEILRNTTFTSSKKDIEAYVAIITKLIKAGVFDDNERQKKWRESQKEAEKMRKKVI